MITVYYTVEDGDLQSETFTSDSDVNKFCQRMDKKHDGGRGWEIHYTERV